MINTPGPSHLCLNQLDLADSTKNLSLVSGYGYLAASPSPLGPAFSIHPPNLHLKATIRVIIGS